MAPLTPDKVAVIVTPDAAPSPVTRPLEFTVTQAVELCQVTNFVTSFVPSLKVAVAFSSAAGGTENVLPPLAVVTLIEVGWLTKNPLHPTATLSNRTAESAGISERFRSQCHIK